MRSPRILAKIFVLSCFILLMSGFVAYRSGAFDKLLYKKSSLDETALTINEISFIDTTIKPDTVIPVKTTMSSSKSMIISSSKYMVVSEPSWLSKPAQRTLSLPTDRATFLELYMNLKKVKAQTEQENILAEQDRLRMYSSKSAPPIKPTDIRIRKRYVEPVLINGAYEVLTLQQVDSLLKTMDEKYPQYISPDTTKKTMPMMSGSKSAEVMRPKDIRKMKKLIRQQEKEEKKK